METPKQKALIERTRVAVKRMRDFIQECEEEKCPRLTAALRIAATVLEDSATAQLVELRTPNDFWARWDSTQRAKIVKGNKVRKLFD